MSRLDELRERIEQREARIAVIGQGYVGLPLAIEFARAGFCVVGIDSDESKVRQLRSGQSYIDDVESDAIREQIDLGRFSASTSYGELSRADCIHVCVPTPLRQTKEPDVSYIVAAVEQVRMRLRTGHLVVLGSTTYPGTTHELYLPLLAETGLEVGQDFSLAFAPERIDPGNRDCRIREVPKVVGGETDVCTRLATQMFETIFDQVVPVSSSQTAEMVKLLENTFRMINIGLANEVARICHQLGLNVWEVIDAAATKPYGFMKFEPGPGLGGHCIPVDPKYLSWKLRSLDYSTRFIDVASDVNGSMPAWVVERAQRRLNRDRIAVNAARILLLGMAYKANVSDTRESPALDIAIRFRELGASVCYHDPHVPEVSIGNLTYKSCELTETLLADADLVVILTAHPGIDYGRICVRARRILDTRNATARVENRACVEVL